MTQVGDIYAAPWGRYRVHRVGAAEVVLVDLASPGAAVVIPAADLEYGGRFARDYVPAGRMPVNPQPQSSAGSAQNEPPASPPPMGAPPFGRLVPDGGEFFRAPPLTLGALRPGGTVWSVPDVETFYWRPCLTPAEDGSGPHCHFIASNFLLNFYCAICRPRRIRIGDDDLPAPTVAPAPPAPLDPTLPPWHPEEIPVWGRVGGARGANLHEWWDERAAVIEEGCKVDRATAERHAYQMLTAKLGEHHGAAPYTSPSEHAPPPAQKDLFR